MVPPELRAVLSTDEPGRRLGEAEDEVAASQAGHLVKAMKVTKATKTQIFTIAMVLFVLLYSVPLMWNVIVVNGHYDYHHDLLLKQMEEHRVYQSRREWRRSLWRLACYTAASSNSMCFLELLNFCPGHCEIRHALVARVRAGRFRD